MKHLHAAQPGDERAPYGHPAALDEAALLKQCVVRTGRSGGPGGQNRNKVETLVVLTHTPTGIEAHAGERRSQGENKHVAVKRLRLALAIAVRMPIPKGRGLAVIDEPPGSMLWRSRARGGRIACNEEHWDFASMLAEALDMLADQGWEPRGAGLMLGVSASQVIKLVRACPEAMIMVNKARAGLGLHALK